MPLEKLNAFTKKVQDLADKPNTTMTAAEVKAQFDAAPDEVRLYLNKLIDKLQSVEDGDSGADNIGITPIGKSPNNLQGALEWLKTQLDDLVIGQFPDGTFVLPEEFNEHTSDDKAHGIGDKSTLKTDDKTSIVGALNELFTNANDVKVAVANAVTAKGVAASPDDTAATLATKIGQIHTGKKDASGQRASNNSPSLVVTGLPFKPSRVTVRTLRSSEFNFYNRMISNLGTSGEKIMFAYTWDAFNQRVVAESSITAESLGVSNILTLNDSGFTVHAGLPTTNDTTVFWEAYE